MNGSERAPRKRLRPILAALLAGGAAALAGCADTTTDADIKFVPVADVRALTLRQAEEPRKRLIVLIDPRAQARFDAAHLPGARNLKLPQVAPKSGIDPTISGYDNIVVYGTDPGNAAARAMTKRLMSVGYGHVRMFAGGVSEWVAKGYAAEETPSPASVSASDPAATPAENPHP